MPFTTSGYAVLLFALLVTFDPRVSGTQSVNVTVEQGTTLNIIKKASGQACVVCIGEGPKPKCSAQTPLLITQNVFVNFTCPRPQDVFTVESVREIICSNMSCRMDVGMKESSLFLEFNRTFSWEVKVPPGLTVQLDFLGTGLRQVLPSVGCVGQHTYTVSARQEVEKVAVGTFCSNGTISAILVMSKGVVSLDIPGQIKPQLPFFSISVGPQIKTFAKVLVVFPSGASASELFSPNYPAGFPDDELMVWDFVVPPRHNATVLFLSHMLPRCMRKLVSVEYHRENNFSVGKKLSDPQPAQRQGNFSMYLRNCKTDTGSGLPALSLHFQVSVVQASMPVLCPVDLRTEVGLSIRIRKTNPQSACEIKADSVPVNDITLPVGKVTNLSFQDCPDKDLCLTVNRTIGCQQWQDCPAGTIALTASTLPSCLPQALQSFTWHLRTPEDKTLELLPPGGGLQQLLPGHSCNSTFSLLMEEDDRASIGHFCPLGTIHKIQTVGNISVTAKPTCEKGLGQEVFANVSFIGEITEDYIFSVIPQEGMLTFLATPGWPAGMKSLATVSWIVSLPPGIPADLLFATINQPKCRHDHTYINVQTLNSLKELVNRREDVAGTNQLQVSESFYLNMSNCQPERRHFSVLSKVTLQSRTKSVLPVVLGTVGGLLLLCILVLVTVCMVIRKKKRTMAHRVSIYNPNGNTSYPGQHLFPKSRADNESHVYAAIEDTMVYGHLLRDSGYGCQQVDVYRTFTGPVEGDPLAPPISKGPPLEVSPQVDVYRPFVPVSESAPPVPNRPISLEEGQDQAKETMVDNQLYSLRDGTAFPLPFPDSPSTRPAS